MMKKLIEEVSELVLKEYVRASQQHGPVNHSGHESYAILKEECEEARTECISTEMHLDRYWKSIKEDDYKYQVECLSAIHHKSILAACEFIQTAAMATKALETIRQNQEIGDKIQKALKHSMEEKRI